jgi:hypothetical protein
LGPVHGDCQTGTSGFFSFKTEEAIEDYCTRDGSDTSLVSSKPHAQLEEEDPADESTKDEGRATEERDEHFNDI